jgi:hypothetical protein
MGKMPAMPLAPIAKHRLYNDNLELGGGKSLLRKIDRNFEDYF